MAVLAMESAPPAAPARGLFKEMARSSSIYLLGSVAQRLAGILLVPVMTRCLTPAEYGMADLIDQSIAILSLLLGLNLSSSLGYFYFRSESPSTRQAVASTTILGAFGLGVVATLVCIPMSAPLAHLVFRDGEAARYFRLFFLAFPATFASDALFSLLRVENRPVAFTVLSLVRLALRLAGVVVLVAILGLGLSGLVYTSVASFWLTAGLLAWYSFRTMRPSFDLGIFRQSLRYAAPLGIGSIAIFIAQVGDRFLLPRYATLDSLGLYVLAWKVGLLLNVAFGSFQTYWVAQSFAIMRRSDSETVFARLVTYVVLGTAFCVLVIVVLARPAVRIMAAPNYQAAASMVPVIAVAYGIRCIGDFARPLFLVGGRPGYHAGASWLGAGLCLAGYLALIPPYGAWGAVWANAAAFTILTAIVAVGTYHLRPYRVEGVRLAKIGAAFAAAVLVRFAVPATSLPALLGLAALSVAVFAGALFALRLPTDRELQSAVAVVRFTMRRRAVRV